MMKIVFLPFAGGFQHSYYNFQQKALKCGIDILSVELPGRGSRTNEPLLTDLNEMVDDVYQQIRGAITMPYGIFGHSMGALIGYLLTRKIIREKQRKPFHLFLSGCAGPSVKPKDPPLHSLNSQAFRNKLRELGGSPEEILENDVLLNIFEPVIRADFQAVDNFTYNEDNRLDIPMTVMIGREEKITVQDARAWQAETTKNIDLIEFPGNHFFLFGKEEEIINIISRKVNSWMFY